MTAKLLGVAAFLLVAFSNPATATTVQPGDDFVLSFSNLPLTGLPPAQTGGAVTVFLTGNLLDAGETVRLEMFENSLADVPFFTNDFTNPTFRFGAHVVLPPPWQDLQGVIRLTALSGSIDLDRILVRSYQDSLVYSQTVDFSTPLPAALPLFATGLGALGLLGWWRKRKQAATV